MIANIRHPLAEQFRHFIRDSKFPCVGAKSALSRGQMRVIVANDVRSARDDEDIFIHLLEFADEYVARPNLFQSLAVLFEIDSGLDEASFEKFLWRRLQSLSDCDERCGMEPDPRVSSDPADPHFSISFGGQGFFVIGLHPAASRLARRFQTPVIVFNPHDQFEQLRAGGAYSKIRSSIIDRDIALAGTANPMLEQFGNKSEARQYSGRVVDDSWICPLHPRSSSAA